MTITLGISAFYHDSAATLVVDGKIVAAAQEERFSRIRHDPGFPRKAIEYVLRNAGINLADVDHVAYYEDPALKFRRVLSTAAVAGFSAARTYAPVLGEWLSTKRRMDREVVRHLRAMGDRDGRRIEVHGHHESHAASAFFPSPFESAAILCIDSVGEWATTTIWHGRPEGIKLVAELSFPHSLGLLYSAFTYFCGFKVDSGEYKLMGLAPYGKPHYVDTILSHLIDVKPDGSFRLDWTKFEFIKGQVMTGDAFEQLFGGPRRLPEAPLTDREFDLAASVQKVTEIVVSRLAKTARELTGETALCMAGGVALNCVANGVISRERIFDRLWVQPAAGDAGGSLGAALLTDRKYRRVASRELPAGVRDGMSGALLGPEYSEEQIRDELEACGAVFHRLSPEELDQRVSTSIEDGGVIGWFQGRMEFGPRSLGSRSILGDPRRSDTQSNMNLRIKFRESFRPFAPVVLEEKAADYFDIVEESPYMLVVSPIAMGIRKAIPQESARLTGIDLLKLVRSDLPAITHVDFSARVQTVDRERNPRFRALLEHFYQRSGCPVLVNTSFNVRGEPIVNTPFEAYRCFMRTNMDVLAIGDFYLDKSEQPQFEEAVDWRETVPLD
ncbi:carbamoyltransferase [Pseudomonas frederiksbergensis]|jgi:carbamoyltransferase|uniref:carbamoyltransferase family protein n=1 Tax=Pseudomonas TaxID=286 RepID=UPI00110E1133|nr:MULTISPECIES: carbamoyltransferase [unclassified Pseudomonas]MBD9618840.1 carbamoyltransferase [Pseudomonas sp. PDM07]QDV96820.1 carbamoyltransferase [Pseudomonas sp. ATCC 43928]CAH0191431.1 Decarbamoylnovobiocin carbamoyltransferase [Pseudomonas sp. Bi130]